MQKRVINEESKKGRLSSNVWGEGEGNLKKNSKRIIVAFLAVICTVAIVSVLFLDAPASAATTSKVLTPTGYAVGQTAPGSALLVYDPRSTTNVASQIASVLQAQGYFVYFAGIDSKVAKADPDQYQVIAVGGPINNGEASSPVQSYLRNLTYNGTLGVFGVGTSNSPNNQIAPLPNSSNLILKETLEINPNQYTTTLSTEFVTQLLN